MTAQAHDLASFGRNRTGLTGSGPNRSRSNQSVAKKVEPVELAGSGSGSTGYENRIKP